MFHGDHAKDGQSETKKDKLKWYVDVTDPWNQLQIKI